MRVALVDPAAFTPHYDHALAASLAKAGADVELVTSRFRFGEAPAADGYVRSEVFYRWSTRMFRRSRLRYPVKVAEHVAGLRRLRDVQADVVHLQWLAVPAVDRRLLRVRAPAVFTAHDLLPRRTAARRDLWLELLRRFERVIVHSEYGREALAGLGVATERLRVIPHPVFPSDPVPSDNGRTLLSLGIIRPYKGLADAIAVATHIDGARLLVAGDPLEPVDSYQRAAGDTAEWRLGYLPEAEVDRALGESTIALFPYRAEIDQSGALLRALGAGVPVVAYDVAGLAEPVRRFGAGRVVAEGDVDALTQAARELLDDGPALAAARAGAGRARDELTWEASAAAHLAVYAEVVR